MGLGKSVGFVVVMLVALSVIILPFPCPDDILVEMGTPDQCYSQAPNDTGHAPGAPTLCPCACHVPIAVGPSLVALPTPLVELQVTAVRANGLEAVSTLITHPPLA